jgi:hypothetical protein
VLLEEFVESSIIELRELGQVVDICNNVAEIFFEEKVILLSWCIRSLVVSLRDSLVDFRVCNLDTLDDFLTLDLLKGKDFIKFALKLLYELLLVVIRPFCFCG